MLDALETRCHFDVTFAYAGRVLTVVGTAGGDFVEFGRGPNGGVRVVEGYPPVDRVVTDVPAAVRYVRVLGLGGDDRLIVSPRLSGIARFSLDGGAGTDRLGGGNQNDTLFGGYGDDVLVGGGRDDYLDGGPGDDVFEDTRGVNVFHGGGGRDRAIADAYDLGSGVESRQSVGNTGQRFASGITDLRTDNGRLTLIYSGFVPSLGADSVSQTGPTRLNDGKYEITATYNLSFGGALVGDFENRWDLQDVARHGVLFTVYDSGFQGPTFSVPFLLPTRA